MAEVQGDEQKHARPLKTGLERAHYSFHPRAIGQNKSCGQNQSTGGKGYSIPKAMARV